MEDLPLGRIAALVPEFAEKDLPLGRTLMIIYVGTLFFYNNNNRNIFCKHCICICLGVTVINVFSKGFISAKCSKIGFIEKMTLYLTILWNKNELIAKSLRRIPHLLV